MNIRSDFVNVAAPDGMDEDKVAMIQFNGRGNHRFMPPVQGIERADEITDPFVFQCYFECVMMNQIL